MIKVTITGAEEGVKYLTNAINTLIPKAMEGLEESLILLKDRIYNRAMTEDNVRYAESVEWEINREQWYGIVGPTLDYAPLEEMGEIGRYIHARCPWWKYLESTLRERVPAYPLLYNVWIENQFEVEEILKARIREAFGK